MTANKFVVHRAGTDIAVFEYGNPAGTPLVLLHGWPDTHDLWSQVIPLLEKDFRLLAIDNRGAGASSVPDRVSAYRVEELAADVFAVINAAGAGPVHILAHDWGSVVGWEMVSQPRAQELVVSFTSVSGPNLDQLGALLRRITAGEGSLAAARALLTQSAASWYTFVFQVPGLPDPVLRRLAQHWPRFLGLWDRLDPALVAPPSTLDRDMVASVKLYRANILQKLRSPHPRPVAVPVQLVLSRRDLAVRPVVYESAEQWVSNLRRSYLDAGHWSPISHPQELAQLTADFVGFIDNTAADKVQT